MIECVTSARRDVGCGQSYLLSKFGYEKLQLTPGLRTIS